MVTKFLICIILLLFIIRYAKSIRCYQCFEVVGEPGCRGYDIVEHDHLNIQSIRLNNKNWYVAKCPGPINACTRPHIKGRFADGTIKDIYNHACATRLSNQFLGFAPNHTITESGCVSWPLRNRYGSTTLFSTCICTGDKCNGRPYCNVNERRWDWCGFPKHPHLTVDIADRILDLEKLDRM